MILRRRKWCYPLSLLLLLVGFVAGNQLQENQFKYTKNLGIFANILKELDDYYVDAIDPDPVVKTGIDAMLRSLDPYTSFLPEEELESFKTFTTGEYGGIGAIIGQRKDTTKVLMLYKDCPAHKGGLLVGDEILQVNGEDMTGRPVAHVSSLLKGMPNTSVQVAVVRYGVETPIEVTLTREKVTLKNVPYYGQVQQGVGYIKLANFTSHAAEEVKAALKSLKENGTQQLILDLRGNPGGFLEEAIKVVNLFIDQGLTVVTTKGRALSLMQSHKTTQPAYDKHLPIIVLIDQKTASAAEIVAGVLQDYDRGVLLGQTTYGKGLVQTTRPLRYNTRLKLTISRYYIPSGRSIQKVDYSRQRQEEITDQMPDVPKKLFTTQAGREVKEGNGITPDLEGEKLSLAPITISLISEGLVFEYATRFQTENDHIKAARDFVLSDAQYKAFISWLKDKDYTYSIELGLDQLLQQAQDEAYTESVKQQITLLKTQIQQHKERDLQTFKSEIKLALQEAIIGRYYFQEGSIEAMLDHDPTIQKAYTLFQDMSQYHNLLEAVE